MSIQRAVPIAIGLVAVVVMLALGFGKRQRASTSLWVVLGPALLPPIVGGLFSLQLFRTDNARALEALGASALASLASLTIASIVLALRAAWRVEAKRSSGAFLALGVGVGGVAALAFGSRFEPGVLVAALPSTAGVLAAWLGAPSRVGSEDVAPDAFETVLAVWIAFGGIACAAIAAATMGLGAPERGMDPHALIRNATLFAIPPAAAAAITLRHRVGLIGDGARRRIPELVAAIAVMVGGAALLRVDLARALRVSSDDRATRVATLPPPPLPRHAEPTRVAPREKQPIDASDDARQADGGAALVSFQPVRVNGMLTPDAVQTRVERLRPRLERCHGTGNNPSEGRLTVRIMIGETGSVSKVWEGDSASSLDRAFVRCALTTFYQVGFPRPTRGTVRVEVPIDIHPP